MGKKETRTVWIADDEQEFRTEEAMKLHEKMAPIMENFTIYGSHEGCKIYWYDFWNWCTVNPKQAKIVAGYINQNC